MIRDLELSRQPHEPSYPWYTTPYHAAKSECAHDPSQQEWCCFVANKLNIFDATKAAVVSHGEGQPRCFRELWMPIHMENRFPFDWTEPNFAGNADRIRQWGNNRHIYSSITAFPQRKLVQMQRNLHRSVFHEYPMPRETAFGGPRTILILDRKGSTRRQWGNVKDTLAMIQQQFGRHNITYLGEQYNGLGPQQQAELFNAADIIISLHGAQLANLIFARSGTKVLELRDGAAKMSRDILVQSEATADEWWGAAGWFTFSRRIGIDHFVFDSSPSFGKQHNPKLINVDPEYVKHFLVTRAHLKPDGSGQEKTAAG